MVKWPFLRFSAVRRQYKTGVHKRRLDRVVSERGRLAPVLEAMRQLAGLIDLSDTTQEALQRVPELERQLKELSELAWARKSAADFASLAARMGSWQREYDEIRGRLESPEFLVRTVDLRAVLEALKITQIPPPPNFWNASEYADMMLHY